MNDEQKLILPFGLENVISSKQTSHLILGDRLKFELDSLTYHPSNEHVTYAKELARSVGKLTYWDRVLADGSLELYKLKDEILCDLVISDVYGSRFFSREDYLFSNFRPLNYGVGSVNGINIYKVKSATWYSEEKLKHGELLSFQTRIDRENDSPSWKVYCQKKIKIIPAEFKRRFTLF